MTLVLRALGIEQQTLASFLGPCSIWVGDFSLGFSQVGSESSGFDWLLAEPEEGLGVTKGPRSAVSIIARNTAAH